MIELTYTMNEDNKVLLGRFNAAPIPSWVTDTAINTWGVVPATNTLADLNPRNNPLLNPNYPNKPEWEALGSFATIITAWCGASYNTDEHELRINLPAGHADYAGAEPYSINLNNETPSWAMLHPPTGALPDEVLTNDGQETTGLYANGRPRAIHTYNKAIYIPSVGHAVVPQGSTSHSGQNGTLKPIIFDQETGEMMLFGNPLTVGAAGNYSGGGSCYDPSRKCVWVRSNGTSRFHRYYPVTDTWEVDVSNNLAVSGNTAIEYIPEYDCILFLNPTFDSAGEIAVLNCATGAITRKVVDGTKAGLTLTGSCQPRRYAANKFACWNNSSNTASIYSLEFDTHPVTGDWSISSLPVASSNTVIPTAAASNGTYGRFFHDADMGIFGVINAVSQPIYFYRYK